MNLSPIKYAYFHCSMSVKNLYTVILYFALMRIMAITIENIVTYYITTKKNTKTCLKNALLHLCKI